MKKNLDINSDLNIRETVAILSGLLVVLIFISSSTAMAETGLSEKSTVVAPQLAPINPDFVKYQQDKTSSQPELSDGHGTGFIPSTVDLSHLSAISNDETSFPAYYDLRTMNKVTSVKDQGSAGSCWAFATYGSLESYLMPGENWDFSENNLKNLLSPGYPEGFDFLEGGNSFMSTAYLARWSGPIDEKDDPYDPESDVSPENLSLQKHVQEVIFLPDRDGPLDNNGIKSAVLKYGAIDSSLYYGKDYYSPTTNSYYYNGNSEYNHDVTIVGWNDSYNKNKFSQVPAGNGAFIVKNSWGSDWGENGFFYISYYDSRIGNYSTIFTAANTNNYKNIYQYDPLGWTGNCGYKTSTGWCANIFTAKSDDTLKAVSFYTTDSNCNYDIYIYTDVSSSPVSQAGPIISQSGTTSYAGYHTIPLNSGVQLKVGQKFSVVLKLKTTGYGYPIAMERPYSDYSSKATANSGESFVSSDGVNWDDITGTFANTNVCIKAFTVTGSAFPVANFSANPTSGKAPLNVAFTDQSTGTPTKWIWSFGDGTTSTQQNPNHKYSKAGNYTVNLTVKNTASSNTVTKKDYIKVTEKPTANFTSSVTSGKAPLNVVFTDTSTGTPTKWKWSFGDGTSSTQQNPTHKYSKAGNYTTTLTVVNYAGSNTATKTDYIVVVSKPAAVFSASPTSGKVPLTVKFTDTSTGNPTACKWSFGDGTTSTEKNPKHQYLQEGNYKITFTVTNVAGSSTATKTNYIKVTTNTRPGAYSKNK